MPRSLWGRDHSKIRRDGRAIARKFFCCSAGRFGRNFILGTKAPPAYDRLVAFLGLLKAFGQLPTLMLFRLKTRRGEL